MSKLEKLIDKYNLENADPDVAVRVLANHGIEISRADVELLQEMRQQSKNTMQTAEGVEIDLTDYDFESILAECQQLSMLALRNHLQVLNAAQAGANDHYPDSLVKTLNPLVTAADKLNGIKETVSENAAIATLRGSGYVVFKSSTEIIEARSNPQKQLQSLPERQDTDQETEHY